MANIGTKSVAESSDSGSLIVASMIVSGFLTAAAGAVVALGCDEAVVLVGCAGALVGWLLAGAVACGAAVVATGACVTGAEVEAAEGPEQAVR